MTQELSEIAKLTRECKDYDLQSQQIDQLEKIIDKKQVYTTIGVYSNLSYVINGVSGEDLISHIKYNCLMRFGRALFVNGHCFHFGYFRPEDLKNIPNKILDTVAQQKSKIYH